jgi:hypothetical protein
MRFSVAASRRTSDVRRRSAGSPRGKKTVCVDAAGLRAKRLAMAIARGGLCIPSTWAITSRGGLDSAVM